MRWSLGPWVALYLMTGCTNFVGADTDGADEESAATSPTVDPTSGNETADTMMTATSTGTTSTPGTTAPTTEATDPASTTLGESTDTTSDNGTTDTSGSADTTGSESTGASAACDNKVLDGNETDVDCGGSCSPCDVDQDCDAGTDCTTGFCAPSSVCGLQQPQVWLDALDDSTLFNDDECNTSPATDGQQVHCWTNKGSEGGLFVDDGDQPNYRENSDGVEFNDDTMLSDSGIFGGALGDVTVFLVQEEVASRNSFDFNLNHPLEGGNRYSGHIPWGNSDRRVIFDIGGSGGGARVATALDVIAVDETHVFSFVNSAEEDQRLIFIDGAQEGSEAGARSANADVVSVGNGNRVILHEFRVYSPSPSGLQRQVIEGQLACRWDLRDELPAAHPFHDMDGASEAGCPPEL